jgi:hypothetical protein
MIVYDFPARRGMPPVRWTWYDGGLEPTLPMEFESTRRLATNGTLVIGSNATVVATPYYESVRIIPETKMKELTPGFPTKTLRRVKGGHFAEWLTACRGGAAAGSNFEYSARLTELCLLGNVAVRARRAIEWDRVAMSVTNFQEGNKYLTKEYRAGFVD